MRSKHWLAFAVLGLTLACGGGGGGSPADPGGDDPGGDDPGGGDDGAATLAKLDISDARALYVVHAANGMSSRLYAITADDHVREVQQSFVDGKGKPTTATALWPWSVYEAGPRWLIVYTLRSGSPASQLWLVRRNDGAAFAIASARIPGSELSGDGNAPPVQLDAAGRIYLATHAVSSPGTTDLRSEVTRIDATDPSHLVIDTVVPLSNLGRFAVTPGGDVFYAAELSTSAPVRRVQLGGTQPVDVPTDQLWLGLDGALYRCSSLIIRRLEVSAAGVKDVPYSTKALPIWYGLGSRLRVGDRLFMMFGFHLTEVQSTSPQIYDIAGYSDLGHAAAGPASVLFVARRTGKGDTLAEWKDGSVADLLTPGVYGELQFAVGPGGAVVVNATRTSDGKKVIGVPDGAGGLTLLDATLEAGVSDLVVLQ